MASGAASAAWGAGSADPRGSLLGRSQDLVLPIAIIASVLVIMVPLPAALMDVLLSANITVAVLVLLTTIYVRHAAGVQRLPLAAAGDDAGAARAQRGRRRG